MQNQNVSASAQDALPPAAFRFHPVRDLTTGEAVSLMVEHRVGYSEQVRFGPSFEDDSAQDTAAHWLAERIERAAHSESLAPEGLRPIYIPAPDAAFSDTDAPIAARAAVGRTQLLPQEFCLEFTDAAFVAHRGDAERRVRAFRKRGFRVSLDMRRTNNTALSHNLRLMLDTIRVSALHLDDESMAATVEAARECGVCVIAERPRWRDADRLVAQGVAYALAPMADA